MIQTVVFDWGDTIMRVFPGSRGPMARWPRVEAVPGSAEVLAALHDRYRLVLATNASESGAALVREALARVGLETYFHEVLTARELGARKPERAFFEAILDVAGCASIEAVMVGDDYQADVVGAKEAGLRAIWFNPAACYPLGHPLYDAETHTLHEVPVALQDMHLPDVGQCLALLAEQRVPLGVVRHAQAVAIVAFRLAMRLREEGEPVNPLLAHRGGLLHDLDKATSRQQGVTHGELAARVLRAKGYPDLAAIAERHLLFTILNPATRPTTWEQKLVYYADKIVEGDRLVGVPEKLDSLCKRYAEHADQFWRCAPQILQLQAEICARLGVSLTELLRTLRPNGDSQVNGHG